MQWKIFSEREEARRVTRSSKRSWTSKESSKSDNVKRLSTSHSLHYSQLINDLIIYIFLYSEVKKSWW
jgi:hypothetical protein